MQAVDAIVIVKKASNIPLKIAPNTLVAANVMAKRITESNMVPKTPTIKVLNAEQRQLRVCAIRRYGAKTKANARYTTAIPKVTHKNTGVTVIIAVKRRIAVVIPMIIPAAIAKKVQSFL